MITLTLADLEIYLDTLGGDHEIACENIFDARLCVGSQALRHKTQRDDAVWYVQSGELLSTNEHAQGSTALGEVIGSLCDYHDAMTNRRSMIDYPITVGKVREVIGAVRAKGALDIVI